MEPVIQYATTSDGVSIAYSTLGEGPVLIFLPVLPLSHLQVEWQMPGMREFIEAFSKTHQIVRFDARGLGLSDRGESERTLDAHMRDLDAVVTRLGLTKFSIFAASYAGPMGIRYAAHHPDRVSRLILWCTHAIHSEVVAKLPQQANQQRVAVNQLAGVDRDLFIRTYLYRAVGWSQGEIANQFVDIAKQSIDPERFFENLANHAAFDARTDLDSVVAPTLVMHRPEFVGSSVDVAKSLTSRMQNARLSLHEGESVAPFIGDTGSVLRVALDFLAEDSAPAPHSLSDSTIRTILYTDVEGHSTMMQRLGDVLGREVLREHERVTRENLRLHGGDEVRTMGDGFLASFQSTQMAIRCAIALQRAFEALGPVHGEEIRVRVGINAGEPISEGDELFGNSVQLAAEIAAHASGGHILASRVVRELVAGKGFHFSEGRDETLKGHNGPIHVHEVHWQEAVLQ
ncbi:MAG: adenylate/guanylate cyclase domain-containing protein [bacterium]